MFLTLLCYISKILKNESNSQPERKSETQSSRCVISQRYWKMKAIHNCLKVLFVFDVVVLYLKDTEKWKQFTTKRAGVHNSQLLCYISKILKNESNSQHIMYAYNCSLRCVISQRYWKMKAIHNSQTPPKSSNIVVLYLKDTEKWKQFTTHREFLRFLALLCYISKILKNESNSQPMVLFPLHSVSCVISQRYWKMKAIHNIVSIKTNVILVVLYLKDTEKWKQFTTNYYC